MNRIFTLFVLLAFLISTPLLAGNFATHKSADYSKTKSMMKKPDIVTIASTNGSFNTLVTALKAADLVETLKGKGPFTVFAPTDEAFLKLPEGTLENLLKPENKKKLASILAYHVVAGKITAKDVMSMKKGMVKSVEGSNISVDTARGVTVDNANVVKTDIDASNGIIHVIDNVIMPKG